MEIPLQDEIVPLLRVCGEHSLTWRGHIVQQTTLRIRQETKKEEKMRVLHPPSRAFSCNLRILL